MMFPGLEIFRKNNSQSLELFVTCFRMNLSIFFRAGVFNTISEVELAFEGSVWVRLEQKLTERGLSSRPRSTWLPTTGPGVTGRESILQLLNYGTNLPLSGRAVSSSALSIVFFYFL